MYHGTLQTSVILMPVESGNVIDQLMEVIVLS